MDSRVVDLVDDEMPLIAIALVSGQAPVMHRNVLRFIGGIRYGATSSHCAVCQQQCETDYS